MVVRSLVLLLSAVPMAASAGVPPPSDPHAYAAVERYMRACEAEWADLDVHRDSSRVSDCLADDYQGVSSHNKLVRKADAIDVGPGPYEVVSTKIDYIHFRHPTATLTIAQGGETALRKDGSHRSLIWHDIWLLRRGRWQIVASQDNVLVDTRK